MTAFYRNRETGIVQSHPTSGLGDSFNSDEIGEDGKPLAYLPISSDKVEAHRASKTPDADGNGSTNKQKGQ